MAIIHGHSVTFTIGGRDEPFRFKDGHDLASLPPSVQTISGTFEGSWEDSFLPDLAVPAGPQSFMAYATPDDLEPAEFKATLELEVSEDDDVSLAIKPDTVQDELSIWHWLIKMSEAQAD
jgi:hypothetical protein